MLPYFNFSPLYPSTVLSIISIFFLLCITAGVYRMLSAVLSSNHAIVLYQSPFLYLRLAVYLSSCSRPFSFVSAFLHVGAPKSFLHLVLLFSRSSNHQFFVSLTLHKSIYQCFPFFIYPSSCPFAPIFSQLINAPFNRTYATPSFYTPVDLSLHFFILPSLHFTVPSFSRHSFSVFFLFSAALFHFHSVHLFFHLSVHMGFNSLSAVSRRPFTQMLRLPIFLPF